MLFQMGVVMGLAVTLLIGLGLQFGSGVFTKDINVKHIISIGVPVNILSIRVSIIIIMITRGSFDFVV